MDYGKIDLDQRKSIELHIKKTYNWEPSDYELKLMDNWDHSIVPLIVAIPITYKVDFSPMYVVMPDKSLISFWDENTFQRIFNAFFSNSKVIDARMLSFLAIKFGKWTQPIGQAIWTDVAHKVPKAKLRSTTEPILTKKGNSLILEFYSMEGERLRISDCRVEITPERINFTAITY